MVIVVFLVGMIAGCFAIDIFAAWPSPRHWMATTAISTRAFAGRLPEWVGYPINGAVGCVLLLALVAILFNKTFYWLARLSVSLGVPPNQTRDR